MKKVAKLYLLVGLLALATVPPAIASTSSDQLRCVTGGSIPVVDWGVRRFCEEVGGAVVWAWDWLHGD